MKMVMAYCGGVRRPRGFTLVEMILAMVIVGIVAATAAVFMPGPMRAYFDSVRRAELADVADLTLRRMSREVRQALPNSIRCGSAGNLCATAVYSGANYYFLEFIPTAGGGAYRDAQDGSWGGVALNFTDPAACAGTLCQFDVIGPMPANPTIAEGDFIVVLNFGEVSGVSQVPYNAYATGDICSNCNRAQVTGVAGNTVTLHGDGTTGGSVFASATGGAGRSDSNGVNRFHLVKSSARGVMYACRAGAPGNLLRFENYGFNATLTDAINAATATTPTVLADNAQCEMSYAAQASLQHTGLLTVLLTINGAFTAAEGTESVTLLRQIHVDNSP